MDTLIAEATFIHDNADTHAEFISALKEFSSNCTDNSYEVALKALSILQDKLTSHDQPIHATEGWKQALNAFKQICNFCRGIQNYGTTILPDVQRAVFSFVARLLENGLSLLYLHIAYSSLQDSSLQLKEYIQNLDENSLRPLILAVCQHGRKEADVDIKVFCDMYERLMIQLFRDTLKKEQAKMFTNDLMDLSVYLYLDCTHLQEDSYTMLADTAKHVLNSLDDPFTNAEDIDRVRSYLKRSGDVVTQPGFTSSEKTANVVKDFIDSFVRKIGQRGLVQEVYTELFDLFLSVTKCPYRQNDYDIKLFEEVYSYFLRIPDKNLSKSPELFTGMAKRYIAVIDEMDIRYLHSGRFADTVIHYALRKLYADNKEVARQWLDMLVPLLKKPCEDTMRACYYIVSNDKGYKWKDHPDVARQVFDLITNYQPPDDSQITDEAEKKKIQELLRNFKSALEYFFDGLKKSRMLKEYGRPMACLSLKLLASKSTELLELSEGIAERTELNPKEDKEFMVDLMKKLHLILKNEDHLWNVSWPLQRAANDFIEHCMEPFKDGKIFTDDELGVFVSICVTCLSYDCVHPDTGQFPSDYFSVFLTVVNSLFNWLTAVNKMNLAEELVLRLMKCLQVDDETVIQLCAVYLNMFAKVSSGQKVVAPYLEDVIEVYLDKRQDMLLLAVCEIYLSNPKAVKSHFRSLMELLEDAGEASTLTYLGMLFQKVSTKQAELFTEQDVEILLVKAQEVVNSQSTFLGIVNELCKRRPESLVPHIDILLDHSSWNPMMSSYYITDMLCTLAIYKQDLASRVLDDMFLTAKSSQDKSSLVTALNSIRMIGFKYPELLKPMRSQLDGIKLVDVDAINMRQTILDMIDGKTSEDMLKQLHKQQEDIQHLVGRVDETEEAVTEVRNDLEQQGEQLETAKKTADEQGQQLGQLQQTVDETVTKVEEIDQKTLSHAPFWARDVSKLLNPVSEHDWRLLSSRLGYSNDDIRGWVQQADPCMAMLNEWYATRKTSEATFAVLTQLQEMDRLDAAIIVENAMKNAEAVVEDEGFEYASPPEVFISYQWAHQHEVRLLKQHLEMAGYECWLDIGQMGGGDKLFEKIDKGIRGAKIIISCVTAKYAKSPNCNREVNLAVSLNKPVIPLLLESSTWPPPGSMGPIFSEYLFVRFYQRGGEELSDERYWPKEKFQELLMQINTFGLPPNEKKIDQGYKHWWMPVDQEIKIDKNKTKNGGQVALMEPSTDDLKAAESPDVFLSYQWGKQKNIIKLYERLTSIGFTCWLDIKQMGGGDSLYDKIDRGVRGCKVVVSCVTQKYALSANCRREVSLADALKKPLLPLLLEQMAWPPIGPMSMVLSQLLYINFTKDESVQMTWDGPQFEELINNIKKHVHAELHEHNTLREDKKTELSQDKSTETSKDEITVLSQDKNAESPKDKNTQSSKDKKTVSSQDESTEPSKDKSTVSPKDQFREPSQVMTAVPSKDKNTESRKDKITDLSQDKCTEPSKYKNTESSKNMIVELSHDISTVSSKFKNMQLSKAKITEPSKDNPVPLSVKSKESRLSMTGNQEGKASVSHAQATTISQNSRKVATPKSVTPDALNAQVRKQQSSITAISPRPDGFTKKQTWTKLSAVAQFSSAVKPSSRIALDKTTKGEQLKLSVDSRRLLEPIPSHPSKNVASKIVMTSKSPVRTQASKKPQVSQRSLRLPPLQHSKSPVSQLTSVKEKSSNTPRLSVIQKKKASN